MNDFRAFNDLDIPCKKEVVISLIELDDEGKDDSYSIRVPCDQLGPISMDLKLSAYKVTGEQDQTLEIDPSLILDAKTGSVASLASAVGIGALNILTAAAEFAENNAVYSLEMEVVNKGRFNRTLFGKHNTVGGG